MLGTIMMGSSLKGMLVGLLTGWFAYKVQSVKWGIVVGSVLGLLFAFVAMAVIGSFLHQGPLYGLVTTIVGGGGALLLYAICSRLLGIEEFRTLMRSVGGRFG